MDEDKTLDLKKIKVQCNLCNRWMPFEMYELHYEKCMDIQYLVNIAKQKGEKFTREDLENCRSEIIERLLKKYPPEEYSLEGNKKHGTDNRGTN